MYKKNTYSRKEKLKSRKALELLFSLGKSFSIFPIKVFYTITPNNTALNTEDLMNIGVGVSARNFKKSVDRNKIKRFLREGYRTQKQELKAMVEQKNSRLTVFFLFIGKELPLQVDITKSMEKILLKLIGKMGDPEKIQQATNN